MARHRNPFAFTFTKTIILFAFVLFLALCCSALSLPQDTLASESLSTTTRSPLRTLAIESYTNAASHFIPYVDFVSTPPSYGDCGKVAWVLGGTCTFGILCVAADGTVAPCLPRCQNCTVPAVPTQFLCGTIRGDCMSTTGCFYPERDEDWCQRKAIVTAQIKYLYANHTCKCGEQCALTTTAPDPTTLFSCLDKSKPPQIQKCAVEAYDRFGHCLQEDDLHVLQVSRDAHTFTTYPRATYTHYDWSTGSGGTVVPSPDLTIYPPVMIVAPALCTPIPTTHPLIYKPQDGCSFEWGCLDLRVQNGLFDAQCTAMSCNSCGENLNPRVRCRARFGGVTQFDLTAQQTDLHYQNDVGCARAANTQPVLDLTLCQCKYGCRTIGMADLLTINDDIITVPYNISLPDSTTSLLSWVTAPSPLTCFYKPTDAEVQRLECDTKIEAARMVYCMIGRYRVSGTICTVGYLETSIPPDFPQNDANHPPPRYYHFEDISAAQCEAELLCRLGADAGITVVDVNYAKTLGLPTLDGVLKLTEPQNNPIGETTTPDQYPSHWTKCNSLCNNMCLGTIPIVMTQSCFARRCSYPYPLGSENEKKQVCYYVQLPYNDQRCDNAVAPSDFYTPRRGSLPTTIPNNLIYSTLQNRITCKCAPYCTTAPYSTNPIPRVAPSLHVYDSADPVTPQPLPNLLEPQTIDGVPLYPCDLTTGSQNLPAGTPTASIEETRLKPETYGYKPVPLPAALDDDLATSTWDVVAHCFKPAMRRALLLNTFNINSPQVIAAESCQIVFDQGLYNANTPLVLDPSMSDFLQTFRCAKNLLQTTIAPIQTTLDTTELTCQPQYGCRGIDASDADEWGDCEDNNGKDLYFPLCTDQTCGQMIFRQVQCSFAEFVSHEDPSGTAPPVEDTQFTTLTTQTSRSTRTPVFHRPLSPPIAPLVTTDDVISQIATPAQISTFYTEKYRPLLAPLYGALSTPQLDSFFSSQLFSTLTNSCAGAPPGEGVCECEPKYLCAPKDTRLKPSATWAKLLQPCFATSDSGTITESQYGFATDCPACQGIDSNGDPLKGENRRDIFCSNSDGTFTSVTDPNATNQCTQARLPKPQSTQSCLGKIACNYSWRCPAVTTRLSQDNWGDSILSQTSCTYDTTFSTNCYVPLSAAQTLLPAQDVVVWNGIKYVGNLCTEAGLRIRTKICVVYTIDTLNRHIPIPAGIIYDKTCHSVKTSDTSIGSLYDEVTAGDGILYRVPKDSMSCVNFSSCDCPASILTGPSCNIAPSMTDFYIKPTLVQPKSAGAGSTYLVAKEESLINASWTYTGHGNNQIFFYLHDIFSGVTGDPISPVFLGKAIAKSQTTPIFIPTIPDVLTEPSSPAQIRAYLGIDTALLPGGSGFQANLGVHIVSILIKCGDVVCNSNNIKIWNTYQKYPTYTWSNTVEACAYIIPTSAMDLTPKEQEPENAPPSQEQEKLSPPQLFSPQQQTLPEPTPISTIPRAIITGCNCVTPPAGITLTMDPTCTIASQCQDAVFSIQPKPTISTLETFETSTSQLINTSESTPSLSTNTLETTPSLSTSTPTPMTSRANNDDHVVDFNNLNDLNYISPQMSDSEPITTAAEAVDPIAPLRQYIDPTGTCGSRGYVPIQHHWIDVDALSVPASCSPQCTCIDDGFSADSKCRTCTTRCNHAADGGSLNATSCSCQCNLGFDGPTCLLCSAYSLFTITGADGEFMTSIRESDLKFLSFLKTFALQLASILQISHDAIRIDPTTVYTRDNAIKMVILLRGNCDGFLNKATTDPDDYSKNSTLLYSMTADQTSIFAIFPRWDKLYVYWRDYQSKVTTARVTDGTTQLIVQDEGNQDRHRGQTAPLTTLSTLSTITSSPQQQSNSVFEVLQASPNEYDIYNNFFQGGVLSATGGTLALTSLYAPKCVGSDCPTGENPYDIAECFTPTDCLPTPPSTDEPKQINDAVLYIIIAVVITILLLLVAGIVVFCCCSSKQSQEDDAAKEDTLPAEQSQQSNPAPSESSTNTESRVDSIDQGTDGASTGAASDGDDDTEFVSHRHSVENNNSPNLQSPPTASSPNNNINTSNPSNANSERHRAMTLMRLQQQSRYDSDCEVEMIHL